MNKSESPFSLPKSQRKRIPLRFVIQTLTIPTDRLNTVRLSQALATQCPAISTGIHELDNALEGGITRGQITEVYGCPGSGKSTFATNLASLVIKDEHDVLWLEGSQCIPASRLHDFITDEENDQEVEDVLMRKVKCISTPTLTSLLVLLLQASDRSVGATTDQLITTYTSLIVLDDLTTLYNAAFPPADNSNQRDLNLKKTRVLTTLGNKLSQIAMIYNIAIVVLSKFTSKITGGDPAQMVGPFGDVWNNTCSTRIVFFRNHYHARLSFIDEQDLRWAAVQKVGNRRIMDPQAIAFRIQSTGIVSLDLLASTQPSRTQSSASQRLVLSSSASNLSNEHPRVSQIRLQAEEEEDDSETHVSKKARIEQGPKEPSLLACPEVCDSEDDSF